MLGEVRVERCAAFDAAAVMLDDFLQRLESTVVHVRRGDGNVAERGDGKLASVTFSLRHLVAARVFALGVEAVVRKAVRGESCAAVAVETVRAILAGARLVFRSEEHTSE